MESDIAKPLTLPCGLTLRNRLVKAALAECWSDRDHLPSHDLIDAYRTWADGGWGTVLTGHVIVDVRYLSTPGDNAVDSSISRDRTLKCWTEWAEATSKNGTAAIMQLNHPGRQGMSWCGKQGLFSKSIAPSAVPMDMGSDLVSVLLRAMIFGTPREMTTHEIQDVISRFANAAKLASEAGFAGVEIHAAHGYLLSQFLSSKINQRTDEYGGTAKQRARLVVEVIHAIRKVVPSGFCVGIKLNSADHQSKGELDECLEQLELITQAGVDFVEVSGGTYEKPTMLATSVQKASTIAREAFFLDFAQIVRQRFRDVPLMVTGGFRTRKGMEAALKGGACDLVGLGRPAVMNPSLPNNVLLNPEVNEADARLYTKPITPSRIAQLFKLSSVTGGAETVWYQEQMRRIFLDDDSWAPKTAMGWMFRFFGIF